MKTVFGLALFVGGFVGGYLAHYCPVVQVWEAHKKAGCCCPCGKDCPCCPACPGKGCKER